MLAMKIGYILLMNNYRNECLYFSGIQSNNPTNKYRKYIFNIAPKKIITTTKDCVCVYVCLCVCVCYHTNAQSEGLGDIFTPNKM